MPNMTPLMPQGQPQGQPPANIGQSEPDTGPTPPTQGGAPSMTPPGSGQAPAPDMSVNNDGSQPQGNPQGGQPQSPAVQQLQQRLDSLPDQDKALVAQYMTPEIIKVIGLMSGNQDVTQYLSQFADTKNVLVPVPREQATAYLQKLQQQQQGQQGQGGAPAPQQAQAPQPAPQQAQAPAPQPQQSLPNGVTPAPMQHGIMAPHA